LLSFVSLSFLLTISSLGKVSDKLAVAKSVLSTGFSRLRELQNGAVVLSPNAFLYFHWLKVF
jgi:hypothetical protein